MPVEINLFSPEINMIVAPAWPTADEQGYANYANSTYSASQAQADNAARMASVAGRIPDVATGDAADANYAAYTARAQDMQSQSMSLDARASAASMNAQSIFNTKNMLNALGADAQAQIEAATAAQMASSATGSVTGTVSLEAAKQGIMGNLAAAVQMIGAGFAAANEQLNQNIAMSQPVTNAPMFMPPSLPAVGNNTGWGAMPGLPSAYSGQDFLGSYAGGYGSPLMNAASMPGMESAYPQGYNMAAMPTYDGTPGSLMNVLLANAPAAAQLAQVALGVGSQVFNQFQQAAAVFTAGVAGATGATPGAAATPSASSPFSTPSTPLATSGGGGVSSPSASLDASATVNGETRSISATADGSGVHVDTSPDSSDSSESSSEGSESSDSGSTSASTPEEAPALDDSADEPATETAPSDSEPAPAAEPEAPAEEAPAPAAEEAPAEEAPAPAAEPEAPAEDSNPSSQLQSGGTTPNVDTVAASNPNTTLSGRFSADADSDGVRATGTTTLTSAAPPEVPSNTAAAQQAAAQAPTATSSAAATTAPTAAAPAASAAPAAAAPVAVVPMAAGAVAPVAAPAANPAPVAPSAAPQNPAGSAPSSDTGRHAAPASPASPTTPNAPVSRVTVEPVIIPAAEEMLQGFDRHIRKGVRVAAALDREYAAAGVDNAPLAVAVIDNVTTIYATAEDFGFPVAGMDSAPRGTKPLSAFNLPEDFRSRWVGADDPAAVLLIAANQGVIPHPQAVVAVDRDKDRAPLDGVDTISRQTLTRISPETSVTGALSAALPTLDIDELPHVLENIAIDWSLPDIEDGSLSLHQAVVARSWADTPHPQAALATIWWLLVSAREALDSGDGDRAAACVREVLMYPLPDTATTVA